MKRTTSPRLLLPDGIIAQRQLVDSLQNEKGRECLTCRHTQRSGPRSARPGTGSPASQRPRTANEDGRVRQAAQAKRIRATGRLMAYLLCFHTMYNQTQPTTGEHMQGLSEQLRCYMVSLSSQMVPQSKPANILTNSMLRTWVME